MSKSYLPCTKRVFCPLAVHVWGNLSVLQMPLMIRRGNNLQWTDTVELALMGVSATT